MVAQEDNFGCGVACVAARLDISYASALRLFEYPERASTRGYLCKHLMDALNRGGVKTRLRYVRKRPLEYPAGTIVFVAKCEKYPAGHYLLRVEQDWMDPWINFSKSKAISAGIRKELPGIAQYAIISDTIAA